MSSGHYKMSSEDLDELMQFVSQEFEYTVEGESYGIKVMPTTSWSDDRPYMVTVDLVGDGEVEIRQWHGRDFQRDSWPESMYPYSLDNLRDVLSGHGVRFEMDDDGVLSSSNC